jgi:hypothetical protein
MPARKVRAVRVQTHHSLLLALALLLGQWLAFAHELQHPALGSDVDCQLCVHAHNLASGAPAHAATPEFARHAQEAPPAAAPVVIVAAQRRLHPIRGPPETQV